MISSLLLNQKENESKMVQKVIRTFVRDITTDWNMIVHDNRMDPTTPFWRLTEDLFHEYTVPNDNMFLIVSSRKVFSTLVVQCLMPLLCCMEWFMLDAGDVDGVHDRVPLSVNRAKIRTGSSFKTPDVDAMAVFQTLELDDLIENGAMLGLYCFGC